MLFACTLICCEPGKYTDVVEGVKKLEGVVDAFGAHGRWDVVVEIEVADLKALGEAALKINGLKGVRASETVVGF
ncbi:MAG: Lrp/AsnC ligand binding domain-containing protein [Candidatus Bathyarchaeia archaeon]